MVEALGEEVAKLALEVPPKPPANPLFAVGSLVDPTVATVTHISLMAPKGGTAAAPSSPLKKAITGFGHTKLPSIARKLFWEDSE